MANEKRLIALDDIFPNLCFYVNEKDPMKSLDELINRINNAPAVDAVEVVHGRWINQHWRNVCSECRYIVGQHSQSKYCPNCGAKMDGGNEDE